MKRVGFVFILLAIALIATGAAVAQCGGGGDSQVAGGCGDFSYYFVTYFSNGNTSGAPDAVLRLINDGDYSTYQSEGQPNGNLWASIYVFDDSQELQECCNCFISADGLLSESLNKELMANTLTGRDETSRGVIKVISTYNPDPTNNYPVAGIRGWMTHIQAASNTLAKGGAWSQKGPFYVTETELADANLVTAEEAALETSCSYAITLGSGYGVCSCTPEDYDF